MLRVCAIVPTYNRAGYLREALAALDAQTRPPEQIVVVDDGSTDATPDVLASRGDRLTVLRLENGGKPRALNAGLAACRCDAVIVCDDDDLLLPDALASLAGALEASDADFAFGSYERFRVDPETGARVRIERGYWPDLTGRSLFLALAEDFFMFQNATLVRTSALARVGRFREDLLRSQDYDMALRLVLACRGVHLPRPVFLQRDHGGARGTRAEPIARAAVIERWIAADAEIFERLCADLPLEAFSPEIVPAGPLLRERGALLQRACVLARRKLWRQSLADVARAVALGEGGPLTESESRICARFVCSKYGCDEIVGDGETRDALLGLRRRGPFAAAVVAAIARPLLWRSREAAAHGRIRHAAAFAALYVALSGPRKASMAAWRRLVDVAMSRRASAARQPASQGPGPT